MKNLNFTWEDGIEDTTDYLFSLAKALGMSVKLSPYAEIAEDMIATSGFAFRMWVAENDLNPSAMRNWNLDNQKPWVENGGLICEHIGRYLGQDDMEEQKRTEAHEAIKASIDRGIPAIVWNVGGVEWGLMKGYDDEKGNYETLSISGALGNLPYDWLGRNEVPFLSVLTITGKNNKSEEDILNGTLKMAVAHLKGEEESKNVTGLDAYPAILKFFHENYEDNLSWNMEYYLGTYASLKYYAYLYFKKKGLTDLLALYKIIYEKWKAAFDHIRYQDLSDEAFRNIAAEYLEEAYKAEKEALNIMEKMI